MASRCAAGRSSTATWTDLATQPATAISSGSGAAAAAQSRVTGRCSRYCQGAVAVEPAGTGVCDNRTRPAPDQGASQMTSQRFRLQGQGPAAYERYLVPAQFAAGAAQLLDLAAVRPGERVLDVACGTGIVARQAAARVGPGGAVTGTDLNQGMLEAARAAAADLPVEIAWHQADAAALPCPAAPSTSPAANRACSTCPTGRPPWPRPAGCWPRGT